MYSDLIVMTFKSPERARMVLDALLAMRKRDLLGLESAVTVTRNGEGQIQFTQLLEPPALGKRTDRDPLVLLAVLIFGESLDRIKERLAGTEIDFEFIKVVVGAMQEYGSALFLLIRPDSIGDTREVIQALTLFRGKVLQTTLSPQGEASMLKALDGR
jgi:uncharacterized membrane protein